MAVKPIPDGYHAVTPYLIIPGVARLIEFLQAAFGAVEVHRSIAPGGRIMHADLLIGDSHIMMGESNDQWKAMPSSIFLYVDDADATFDRAVAAGAEVIMPVSDQFHGDRMGGVKDVSGNCWWIATHIEDVSPDEMKRRQEAHFAKAPA